MDEEVSYAVKMEGDPTILWHGDDSESASTEARYRAGQTGARHSVYKLVETATFAGRRPLPL